MRIFNVQDGKLLKVFDETIEMYSKGTELPKDHKLYISKEDFEKRAAVERDLDKVWELANAGEALPSLQFD